MTEHAAQEPDTREQRGRTVAEWTTLGISLALLALVFGAITWLWIRDDSRPPVIRVTPVLDMVRTDGDAWYVPIEVSNEGDRTAEDVVIEAELDAGQGEPETAEITFTFLSSGETVRGTVILGSDPASGNLTVRPVSFKEP